MVNSTDFMAYEKVRLSGITNMFAVNVVTDLTGLTRDQVFDIMKNYDTYSNLYLKGAKNDGVSNNESDQ